MIVALIPAHNEEESIAAAIKGLYSQTMVPDVILVVADNCTDQTHKIAWDTGAQVFFTRNNKHKKAGGLNQALDWVLSDLSEEDLILVQDADTVLANTFVETAHDALQKATVGAVGGIFYGEPGGGILGQFQRNEYIRYARETERKNGKCSVLTGTGTMFRVKTLREVKKARVSGRLGGGSSYYSFASLTEDDEITKAVKTLGYKCLSPKGCEVITEVMLTTGKLWNQRMRWQRGALENLRDYGWTKVTAPYFLKQIAMGLGAVFFTLYLALTILMVVHLQWNPQPFWLAIGGLFVVERVVTVRRAGAKGMLLALIMIPETVYDMFINAVFVASLFGFVRRTEERWAAT